QRLQQDSDNPTYAQLLAAREGRLSEVAGKAAARITFRRFFLRYAKLSAFVNDVELVKKELFEAYNMPSYIHAQRNGSSVQVSFEKQNFLKNLKAIDKKSQPLVHIIETANEEEAVKIARIIGRALHTAASTQGEIVFQAEQQCLWIKEEDHLEGILNRRNILPTDNQLVFITIGLEDSKLKGELSREWRYSWLARMNVDDLGENSKSRWCQHLIRYANSNFPGAYKIGRWVRYRALRRHADEAKEFRKSLVKLDQQYRKMISFTGSGN
ncbi:MAG: hypothetical protein JKX94_11280, partial [Sneathiella sp.]|nr:hypothetical protein [Sneathiella sp.]